MPSRPIDIQDKLKIARSLGWTIKSPKDIRGPHCKVRATHSCGSSYERLFSSFYNPSAHTGAAKCSCYVPKKTGPKISSPQERVDAFNSVNSDRKAKVSEDGRILIKHYSCGKVYQVPETGLVKRSVADRLSSKTNLCLSSRYRGLGCPHCEVDPDSALSSRQATNLRKYGSTSPVSNQEVQVTYRIR